ncbi:hypothetical protein D3P09_10740 [Paenibacillus pinisoli]|uniref:Peptidase metallopeptidase domain-containing protein n=1 Tax=Paenibacillus pinisoli TaxID=1276110 RepID=A0A3A6PE19_9BACL|nr:matrixin family metalloprotease [Paenibacillus pinisoli]RJX39862.1 hypothetical protein D3P09_10740 [Paenibacillus pinisoli]
MPTNKEWLSLQQALTKNGFLQKEDHRDIRSVSDLTPALREAIQKAGGRDWKLDQPIRAKDIEDLIAGKLKRRYCGVPERSGQGGITPQAFGAQGGRWRKGALRVSIDTSGCSFVNAPGASLTPAQVIGNAFNQWQAASNYFRFTIVPAGSAADIRIRFGDGSVDSRLGTQGGVLAFAAYPEEGSMWFDSTESWSERGINGTQSLLSVAIHEIGHALGLTHSSKPGGTMYPYDSSTFAIDAESQEALNLMYGWSSQKRLGDRGTSDRVALAVASVSNFSGRIESPRMVWKGLSGDSGIYESELQSGNWSSQRRISGIGSSHSPALAEIAVPGDVPRTGLFMAWKGVGNDQGLYWSRDNGGGWEAQRRISGVGSSTRPSIASAAGRVCMAWKGIQNDSGIYWSTFDAASGAWSAQQRIPGIGTTDSPALVGSGNRLYMFWKGIQGDSGAYWSVFDFGRDPIWRPQRRIEYYSYQTAGGVAHSIGTSGGIAAARHGDSILLAWKGIEGDSGIYYSILRDTEFGGQIRVPDVGTLTGPGLAAASDGTLMAWRGIGQDHHIYWSRL